MPVRASPPLSDLTAARCSLCSSSAFILHVLELYLIKSGDGPKWSVHTSTRRCARSGARCAPPPPVLTAALRSFASHRALIFPMARVSFEVFNFMVLRMLLVIGISLGQGSQLVVGSPPAMDRRICECGAAFSPFRAHSPPARSKTRRRRARTQRALTEAGRGQGIHAATSCCKFRA